MKPSQVEVDALKLFLANTDLAGVGDAGGLRGSATPGNFYVALHTADPGDDGDQTTYEVAYSGYARQALARTSASWTFNDGAAEFAAAVTFPAPTSRGGRVTHYSLGTAATGAGRIIHKGSLKAPVVVESGGDAPAVAAGTRVTE